MYFNFVYYNQRYFVSEVCPVGVNSSRNKCQLT